MTNRRLLSELSVRSFQSVQENDETFQLIDRDCRGRGDAAGRDCRRQRQDVDPAGDHAQFEKLDSNRDGRISQSEAATDSKIVFSTVDKNGDGYLDSSEYAHRSMSNESDSTVPRQ